MAKKTYLTICPVCGGEGEREAEFMSGDSGPGGRIWLTCGGHSGEAIRDAYEYRTRTGRYEWQETAGQYWERMR